MHSSLLRAASLMLALSAAPVLVQAADAPAAQAAATVPAKDAVFTTEQLDQMLASIALYPDPLLAQVLMAATYPGEVAEAVTWSKAHPDAKGDDAVKQVASQTWDPSVQALVAFPQVLATLGQDPVWVQRLGDAFLAQPDELMAGVQRLRRQAQTAGNLQSNQYQNVTVQNVTPPISSGSTNPADNTTIIIQPADPQVVYVPTYNPTTTYGTWPYPASPPVYYPPPPAYYPGQALVAGLAFGTGVAVVASLWGDCDWGNNDIDIDVNRYNNINGNNRITNNQNKWQHNNVHRDGVPYRDNRSRAQYGRQLDGAAQRDAYRGDNAQRAQARERARSSMDRAGIERPATSNREARNQVREAQSANAGNRLQGGADRPRAADRTQGNTREARQPGVNQRETRASQARPAAGSARNNAFAGARSPSQTRVQADRGRASQISAQRPNTSRAAGHQISRPSGGGMRQRGGGRR
ncbi:DUF3300 domain-containing protein [Pseudomonas sp. DR 5-09]|uniref:DUF3300 domain-containing protein n=1 Tax=Pseudomonas sp. DR 5-09 TaxID=1534110 RepID=UPI0007E4253A|nr:DUF3300 domain-containing protein [Pseudomonas sp. DR 5-09]